MHKSIQQRLTAVVLGIALSLTLASHALAGQFEDGVTAYYQKNYPHAFELWVPLAEKGDAMSQVLVGSLFAFGQGVKRNDLEAVRWYGQAAFQGNAQGQFNLAIMYEHGWGVGKSLDLAIYWYGKAAVQGRQDARERLATLKIAQADQPDKTAVKIVTSAATPPVKTPLPAAELTPAQAQTAATTKSTADTKLHLAGAPEPLQDFKESPEYPAVVPKASEASSANDQPFGVTPMNMATEASTEPAPAEKVANVQAADPGGQDDAPPDMTAEQAPPAEPQAADPGGQGDGPPESQGIFSFFGSMFGNILNAGSTGEEISFDGDDSFEEEQWKEDIDRQVASKPAEKPQKDPSSVSFLPTADGWKGAYADEYDWQASPKASAEADVETEYEIPPAPADVDEPVKKATRPVAESQLDEDSDLVRLPNGRVMLTIPKKDE